MTNTVHSLECIVKSCMPWKCGKRQHMQRNTRMGPPVSARCLLTVLGKPGVQTNAAHGLELYSFIGILATRYTCVLVYRANPASGHGIVTLHDRYVTIPCPALMTGVYKNTIESKHGVGLD